MDAAREIIQLKTELLKEQIQRRVGFSSVEAGEIAINYLHEFNGWLGRYWERKYRPEAVCENGKFV